MKEQSNELFFVQVKKPNEVRKDILETLRKIVETLQKFEKFKHIRHEKLEKIRNLGVLLKQANKILGDLRLKLPQTNLRATAVREASPQPKKMHHNQKKKIKAAEEKSEKAPKKELTEIDKLEAELSAIESKLKMLT